MSDDGKRQKRAWFVRHKAVTLFTVLGLAVNIAYMLNSYLGDQSNFAQHLGDDLVDHVIIILILPLLFTVGYLADRSRASQRRLEKVLERETYISQSLQKVFYPRIRQIKGYELGTRYRSVLEESELGGEFYDVFSLGGNRNAVVMADVSGKGLQAAALGAFVKSAARAFLRETSGLPETVARISSATYHEHGTDIFVTAFIGVLHCLSGSLRYVNAGHPGPLHVKAGKAADVLYAESMPLGMFQKQEFVEGEIVLEPDDCLVLYTDGLYEFRNEVDAFPETIAHDVLGFLPADADTLAGSLLANAENLAEGVLNDDVAVLVLRRKP